MSDIDLVTNRVDTWVRTTRVYILTMVGSMVANELPRNLATTTKQSSLIPSVVSNTNGSRGKDRMMISREIDGELKFSANDDETAGDVSPNDWCTIPSIEGHEDAFLSNTIGPSLIAEDSEGCIKKSVDSLDDHRIVVATRQDMDVD